MYLLYDDDNDILTIVVEFEDRDYLSIAAPGSSSSSSSSSSSNSSSSISSSSIRSDMMYDRIVK